MAEAAQGAEQRAARLAIHPQAQRAGALSFEQERHVGAPELDRRDLRADLQSLGDFRRDPRQAQRLVLALRQRNPLGQLAQPLRRLFAPHLGRRERPAQRCEA